MPLMSGSSRAIASENIRTLRREGYAPRQAIAIALQKAGLSNKQRKPKPKQK